MTRELVRRLFSTALAVLSLSGGGGLSVLDTIVFHVKDRQLETFRPHYEASDGCHVERCVVRSTASDTRWSPEPPVRLSIAASVAELAPRWSPAVLLPQSPTSTLHSRAPPSPV